MVETIQVRCARGEGELRGRFGIVVEDRKSSAWVRDTVDPAKAADLVRKGDRITHIDGVGPLNAKAVCEALKAAPAEIDITVVRGETPPRAGFSAVNAMSCCTLAVIVCAMSWTALDMPSAEQVLNQLEGHQSRQRLASEGIGQQAMTNGKSRGPAMSVGGRTIRLAEDGSAEDPADLRAAMRADKGFMDTLRDKSPDWARIVAGRADGTFDVDAFQNLLRKNFKAYQTDAALKLNDDGTAVDPAAYLGAAKSNKKWMKMIKAHPVRQLTRIV